MKTIHILSLLFIVTGCMEDTIEPDDQPIDFPDPNFKQRLIDWGVDKNKDGEISLTEARMVKDLGASYAGISDFTGIELFENLERFACKGNQLTGLTINGLEKLTMINCSANQLSWLDVSGNARLGTLICNNNQLTQIDLSGCYELLQLDAHMNQISSLDISDNIALSDVNLAQNQFTQLDFSNCTYLYHLVCDNNQLTRLNLTGCKLLYDLFCENNRLSELDITACGFLVSLVCSNNLLSTLDLSYNTSLLTSPGFSSRPDPNNYGYLDISNMPTLVEVCVWEMPFPPEGKEDHVITSGSPNVSFVDTCQAKGITF